MNRSENINELAASLAKAQAKIATAPKDSLGKVQGTTKAGKEYEYTYQYSTLADVWTACRAALSENGLAVIQTAVTAGAMVKITTLLAHASGQWVSEETALVAANEKPQSVGSAITYGRRYTLAAMVGVVSDEDDDGAAATHGKQPEKPNGKPAGPPTPTADQGDEYLRLKKLLIDSKTAAQRSEATREIRESHAKGLITDLHRAELVKVFGGLPAPEAEAKA